MLETGNKIVLLGAASSFVGEAIEIAEEAGLEIAALVTNIPMPNETVSSFGYELHSLSELLPELRNVPVVAILATPAYREIIVEEAKANGVRNFAVLQDSRASVSKSARLGPGSIIGNGTIIASRTELGAHVFVNRGVIVGHDCVLEDYCTIAPGANIGGLTRVKTGAYIGIGATVFNKITIGRNSIIAGGAVVTKDVPDNTMVAGVPAIIKKENIVGYRGA